MTKKADLLKLLGRQWVTPLDALQKCQIFTLAQRVSEWRADGMTIAKQWRTMPSGARVRAYRLIRYEVKA